MPELPRKINCDTARRLFGDLLAGSADDPHQLLSDHLDDCDACYDKDWLTCREFQALDADGAWLKSDVLRGAWQTHYNGCRACHGKSLQRYLRAKGVRVEDYPCACLANACHHECDIHADAWECPDTLLVRDSSGGFGIPIRDGGPSVSPISFCPWCGTKVDQASAP